MRCDVSPAVPSFLAALSVLYMQTVYPAPVIDWVPSKQSVTITAGESTTTVASFTISESASNISVRVVPALARFVSTTSATFAVLQPSNVFSVSLVTSVPADTLPQVIEGTIQLRNRSAAIARPLPLTLRIEWPQQDRESDLGVKVSYPPSWHQRPREGAIAFSNFLESSEVSEASLSAESLFLVQMHPERNPNGLSLNQWFDEDVRPVSSESILFEEYRVVDGRSALYVEIAGVGGRRAHYFILRGNDVLEVTYGLFAPKFLPYYEAMLNSLAVVD